MKIKANGISQNYELTGSGKTLTLIHGYGDNLDAWWNQVPVFSQRYRVLTYDMRGHGETETPPGEFGTAVFTEDLYALLQALNIDETYLLGYSMGGGVAVGLAIDHPGMVKALILASGGVGGRPQRSEEEMKEMAKLRQERMEAIEKHGLAAIIDESVAMSLSPGFAEKNKEVFERYKAVQLKNNVQSYLRLMRAMSWQTSPPDLSQIRCPILIIGAERDQYMGAEGAKAAQQRIAGAKLKIMATGHAAQIEKPEEFNSAVLEFLARIAD